MLHRPLANSRRACRRVAAAGVLVVAAATVSACGFNYDTDRIYTQAQGANQREYDVNVLGAAIVSSSDGSGTFVATLSNTVLDQDDTLTGLSGDVTAAGTRPVKVAGGGFVNLAERGGIKVTGDFAAGDFVTVTLEFQNSDSVEVQVPVVRNDHHGFEGLDGPVTEEPTTSHSETPSETPAETPTGTDAETPTETPAEGQTTGH